MMERPKRTQSPSRSSSIISKKQRNESADAKISITTFEDLSNELIYNIFDYMDYTEMYMSFSQLNKRFWTLVKDYPTPTINFNLVMSNAFETVCRSVILPHKHRIRSIQLAFFRDNDAFINTCCKDGSFLCLESIKLRNMEPSTILSTLSYLQTLPSLYQLSLGIDVIMTTPPDMTTVYQMLLGLKSLKSLEISTTDFIPDDYFDISIPLASNQQPSNLEYLAINHLISIYAMLSFIRYIPKLRHLCLESLDGPYDSVEAIRSTVPIPKLSQLIKLNMQRSALTVKDLGLLLNAFDCRLKTLKIETSSYSSFCIDEQWKNLMETRLSDLDIFEIDFSRLDFSHLLGYDDHEEATEAVKKRRIQSSVDFVCDSFWYDHGWMAEIFVTSAWVYSSFYHSKMPCNATGNREPRSQPQKLIHFNDRQYQSKNFSLPVYLLHLSGDLKDFEGYFSNSTANISYLPIKQLTIYCSNLSILDLIRVLKRLPHVTFLSVNAKSFLEIEDQRNESTNAQAGFNNIDRLEINAKMPWKMVAYLIQHFPNLMNLHVYGGSRVRILDTIFGSLPFNERTDAEYFRRVNLMKEDETENSVPGFAHRLLNGKEMFCPC